MNTLMIMSERGKKLIKSAEGCGLVAYQCSSKVWTIGYGHTGGVKPGDKITREQADKYFDKDIQRFERYVNKRVVSNIIYKLTQGQYDALVAFAYNLGSIKSGFYDALLVGDLLLAVQIMVQYVKSSKIYKLGLHRRRILEALMFTGYELNTAELSDIRHRYETAELNAVADKMFAWYEVELNGANW